MKRLIALSLACLMLLCACDNKTSPDKTTNTTETTTGSDTTTAKTTTASAVTTTEVTTVPAEKDDLSALKLLDYHIDDEGRYLLPAENWELLDDYTDFRKYFFGTWKSPEFTEDFILDDSEKCTFFNNRNFWFTDWYKVSDNVLLFRRGSVAGTTLFWLDINNPDVMYAVTGFLEPSNNVLMPENGISTLTKTDAAINEPERNYVSVFKLHEMSEKYEIDFSMLVDIEHRPTSSHNGSALFYPVYLLSESKDNITLATKVGNGYDSEFEVTYELYRKDGKWNRTCDIYDAIM